MGAGPATSPATVGAEQRPRQTWPGPLACVPPRAALQRCEWHATPLRSFARLAVDVPRPRHQCTLRNGDLVSTVFALPMLGPETRATHSVAMDDLRHRVTAWVTTSVVRWQPHSSQLGTWRAALQAYACANARRLQTSCVVTGGVSWRGRGVAELWIMITSIVRLPTTNVWPKVLHRRAQRSVAFVRPGPAQGQHGGVEYFHCCTLAPLVHPRRPAHTTQVCL